MKLYKGPPHEGFYVYSSRGCGEESAISVTFTDLFEKAFTVNMNSQEALDLARLITEVSVEYENGSETGIDREKYIE